MCDEQTLPSQGPSPAVPSILGYLLPLAHQAVCLSQAGASGANEGWQDDGDWNEEESGASMGPVRGLSSPSDLSPAPPNRTR